MNKEYQCKNCRYFFGKEEIHCAIHPYGKESEYCSDWQPKNLSLQGEKPMNIDGEIKSFSYSKLTNRLLAIGATLFVGYQLYQNIPPAIHASKDYDRYKIECEIFLERASKAGTTKIASVELTKGVSWLESKSLTQSFEYKDLKNNLDYLKKQLENIAMPVTISDSISSNFQIIKNKQIKLQMSYWSNLYECLLQFTLFYILILFFIAVLEVYFEL